MIKNFKNSAGREYWVCGTGPGHQERQVGGNCVTYIVNASRKSRQAIYTVLPSYEQHKNYIEKLSDSMVKYLDVTNTVQY
jgi:hypothetical protein